MYVCLCMCILYTLFTLFNFFLSVIFAYHMLQMMLDGSPILFSHWLTGTILLALFLYLEVNSLRYLSWVWVLTDWKTYLSKKSLSPLNKILLIDNRPLQSLSCFAMVSDLLPCRLFSYPSPDIQLSFFYSWNSKPVRNRVNSSPSGKNLVIGMNKMD